MIRYGVIGIQGIGRHHIRWAQAHPNVRVVALADVDEAAVNEAARDIGAAPFSDYRTMLATSNLDAVAIATPHHLLADIGLACLQHNAHIFVEKPFAIRLSDADKLVLLAAERNKKIAVAYQYRTYAVNRKLKEMLDNGKVGTVQRVLWTWFGFRPNAYYERAEWRATWGGAGGGLIANQLAHDIDLLRYLFGEPRRVTAQLVNRLHDTPLDDALSAIIEFASGATVVVQASINQPQLGSMRQIVGDRGLLYLPQVHSLTRNRAEKIIFGRFTQPLSQAVKQLPGHHDQPAVRQRTIRVNPRPSIAWRVLRRAPLVRRFTRIKARSGHVALFESFIQSILTGSEPLVNGADARNTVQLCNALILSAFEQRTIELPVDAARFDTLLDDLAAGRQEIAGWG